MEETTWNTIERIVAWIDESSTLPPETDKLLRVMKLSEEVGEVTQALIGVMGQNPRKGRTHRMEDVYDELSDVILTAMTALRSLTPDARKVFEARVEHIAQRALAPAG
ncbi:MazG-like family protein [Kitasatospora sp. RB6PN24]|uniref:MazG-like family protein n=1 Tax=Kitasatospora humi TaxID=2893891 RepID=UPI001E29C250|nr:MazG-like family protein [Kitasatospora humi]MCC9311149.1 MazG-like family protein [Kitasatospora humi]